MPAKTYAQVVDQQRRALAQARLDDPGEHFPYKHSVVTQMLAEGTPMGPGTPGELDGADDDRATIDDFMTVGIADASRDYVDAQAAYLADPTDEALAGYNAARDRLLAARLDHRSARGEGFTVVAARRAG